MTIETADNTERVGPSTQDRFLHHHLARQKANEKGAIVLLMDSLWRQNLAAGDPPCYVVLAKFVNPDDEGFAVWVYNAKENFFGYGDYFHPPKPATYEQRWENEAEAYAAYFERRKRG